MCKAMENGNASKEESMFIVMILEEFYDPDVSPVSEEDLEEILIKYGADYDDTYSVDKMENDTFDQRILEEYYDPNCTLGVVKM